jgi:hypothetical protein
VEILEIPGLEKVSDGAVSIGSAGESRSTSDLATIRLRLLI